MPWIFVEFPKSCCWISEIFHEKRGGGTTYKTMDADTNEQSTETTNDQSISEWVRKWTTHRLWNNIDRVELIRDVCWVLVVTQFQNIKVCPIFDDGTGAARIVTVDDTGIRHTAAVAAWCAAAVAAVRNGHACQWCFINPVHVARFLNKVMECMTIFISTKIISWSTGQIQGICTYSFYRFWCRRNDDVNRVDFTGGWVTRCYKHIQTIATSKTKYRFFIC